MNIETIEYGEVINSTLLNIFGDEMTYNELKLYAKYKNDTTYLKVEFNRCNETLLVRVWFNTDIVLDKEYSINHSCDMFYLLNELEPEEEEEEIMVECYDCDKKFFKKDAYCILGYDNDMTYCSKNCFLD